MGWGYIIGVMISQSGWIGDPNSAMTMMIGTTFGQSLESILLPFYDTIVAWVLCHLQRHSATVEVWHGQSAGLYRGIMSYVLENYPAHIVRYGINHAVDGKPCVFTDDVIKLRPVRVMYRGVPITITSGDEADKKDTESTARVLYVSASASQRCVLDKFVASLRPARIAKKKHVCKAVVYLHTQMSDPKSRVVSVTSTSVFVVGNYCYKTIVLPAKVRKRIKEHFEHFMSEEYENTCSDRGSPWATGMVLYGPPGTGKTTLPIVLAYEYHAPLWHLCINDLTVHNVMSFTDYIKAKMIFSRSHIIVMDELDKYLQKYMERDSESGHGLAALLLFLDSLISSNHGRITIATLNDFTVLHHPRFAPLFRPGRLHLRVEMSYFDAEGLHDMFAMYDLDYVTKEQCAEFVQTHPQMSPASVRMFCAHYTGNPRDILDHLAAIDYARTATSS
jgi:ATP-dependent 26S proteasome regulatory subunit